MGLNELIPGFCPNDEDEWLLLWIFEGAWLFVLELFKFWGKGLVIIYPVIKLGSANRVVNCCPELLE